MNPEIASILLNAFLALVGLVLSTGLMVIGYFLSHQHKRLDEQNARLDAHIAECQKDSASLGERLARVEETTESTHTRFEDFCDRLNKIDGKLDRLIERSRP